MPIQGNGEQPLDGVAVIELGQIVSAPMATSILGDLGADVIKVERPGAGDRIRNAGDVGDAMFQSVNRNKDSIAIDLKSAEGQNVYLDLVRNADIVVENLGPGKVEKLGVGYEALSSANPGVVYLSIKGFFKGPYGDRAGMDVVAEAMAGFMKMTGQEGDKPLRAGTSVADYASALYGVIGVLLALQQRESTGTGQKITSGIFESMAHWMNYWIAFGQLVGDDHPPLGASHPSQTIYDAFETADEEYLFIGVVSDGQWEALCEILDRSDLVANPAYDTAANRLERKDELLEIVKGEVRRWEREELLARVTNAGIPGAPINYPSDLVDDEHLSATGLLTESWASHRSTQFKSLLAPISGDRITPTNEQDPPTVGEHTDEVLARFGFEQDEIEALRDRGVVDG